MCLASAGSRMPEENPDTALPPGIIAVLGDSPTRSRDHEGRSGSVEFVDGGYWMKRGPAAVAERPRLNWLAGKGIPVPPVVAFERDVLILADVGAPSLSAAADESVGATLGTVLRRLHAIPIAECPFDGRLDVVLERARHLVEQGLVDPEDMDNDHYGLTPEQVLDRLYVERPEETDLVVAHGDYTSGNVLRGGIVLDVGALGIADRYRDLALARRDLLDHHGLGQVEEFFAAYGLVDPDPVRLDYYRLLDELF
ncbi:aminoglycoside 3'-phosphotransferase [Nocardia terpenica]|nr:aminoglycoside 3'-phosphotransferase [Nocardia terpenica]